MASLVLPKCYWVGYSEMNEDEVLRYLKDSGNEPFLELMEEARGVGLTSAEILCSMFAKMCYKSLSEGKNANITRTRSVKDNLENCHEVGHGSVFEHVGFNFVISDCSRVFTHELVRHRIGTAFSQTSGRYCRLEDIALVFDPILAGCEELVLQHLYDTEDLVYKMECKTGLRVPNPLRPECPPISCLMDLPLSQEERAARRWVPNDELDFGRKKKLTSAIRRIAPNGQANEMGFSVNLRSLRHTLMMRTGRHSEWEIRLIFEQLYNLLKGKYPTIFHGAKEEVVEGIVEVSGMRMQPYERAEA